MDYLKVSSKSSPASVAGAIAGLVKDGQPVEIQSVGAGAVNQAIKAIAIARGFLVPTGVDVVCAPVFQDIRLSVIAHPLVGTADASDPASLHPVRRLEVLDGTAAPNPALAPIGTNA